MPKERYLAEVDNSKKDRTPILTYLVGCLILFALLTVSETQASHRRAPEFVDVPGEFVPCVDGAYRTTVSARSRVLVPDVRIGPIRYQLRSGPGTLNSATGEWEYVRPSYFTDCDTQTVVIAASQDGMITTSNDACRFKVILCEDSPCHKIGDLNLNELAFEIADAVLYTDYFVYGPDVLWDYEAQSLVSDINGDGDVLSVADLVCNIRYINGDWFYRGTKQATVRVRIGSYIDLGDWLGAAHIIIEGNATPELMDYEVEMRYAYDAEEDITRVLVYSFQWNQGIQGPFLRPNGNVLNLELATWRGQPVRIEEWHAQNYIYQPYPNPFSTSTTITVYLMTENDVTLEIFNILGELVYDTTGHYEAGSTKFTWDGTNNSGEPVSPGVYFYRVTIDGESTVGSMIMLRSEAPAQNYPNPFNGSTTIPFYVPQSTTVELVIYNMLGQQVHHQASHFYEGDQVLTWDGTSDAGQPVASGIYFYRITIGDETHTRKMMLIE
ncbi:MAG: T9SS type A sorting domain-containing protein [candidate division Zixibacteria bacterium]|nr:T9SS type A sorting domain-containing protein [candidate division Zixibacteria bacterium]